MNIRNSQKGQSLLEVLVAILIFVGVILGVVTLVFASFNLTKHNLHETKASYLAQEGFEAMRRLRDESWSNLSSLDPLSDYYLEYDNLNQVWSLSVTPNTVDGYTRIINIDDAIRRDENLDSQIDATDPIDPTGSLVDSQTKIITITVSWDEKEGTRSVTATSYLADWR